MPKKLKVKSKNRDIFKCQKNQLTMLCHFVGGYYWYLEDQHDFQTFLFFYTHKGDSSR